MSQNAPRTTVEFVDVVPSHIDVPCHKAKEIRINGVPVLVEKGSVDVNFGENEVTTITLTLQPTTVSFIAAPPYEAKPSQSPAWYAASQAGRRR